MSLINQMLKDLEHRGAGASDVMVADTEKAITSNLGVVSKPQTNQMPTRLPFIKIGAVMALLAAGAYFWVQGGAKLPNATETEKTIISNLNPQAVVNVTNPTTTQKLEVPDTTTSVISYPVTAAPAINPPVVVKPAEITSTLLFATELKYNPMALQSPTIKADKDKSNKNLIPDTALVKPVKPVEPTKPIVPEKTVTDERAASKPVTKPNMDNASIGKQIRPDQKSSNFYRQAINNLQQGRVAEAQANLTQALEANPANQEARQTLAGLLLDNKRNDEAKATLAAGLLIAPEQSDFRMALARLQVEAGDRAGALNTLEQGLTYAKGNADYQSFWATLLQRADRHEEAINHYMTALSLNATAPNSLVGLGISLQAVGKLENAQDAFTRAQAGKTLSPELSMFVEQRLKQISQRLHH